MVWPSLLFHKINLEVEPSTMLDNSDQFTIRMEGRREQTCSTGAADSGPEATSSLLSSRPVGCFPDLQALVGRDGPRVPGRIDPGTGPTPPLPDREVARWNQGRRRARLPRPKQRPEAVPQHQSCVSREGDGNRPGRTSASMPLFPVVKNKRPPCVTHHFTRSGANHWKNACKFLSQCGSWDT